MAVIVWPILIATLARQTIDLDVDASAVIESAWSPRDFELRLDPEGEEWREASRVIASRNYVGEPIAGPADRDPLAVDEREPVPALHLSVRRAEPETRPHVGRGDTAPVELGRRRSVHRLRLSSASGSTRSSRCRRRASG